MTTDQFNQLSKLIDDRKLKDPEGCWSYKTLEDFLNLLETLKGPINEYIDFAKGSAVKGNVGHHKEHGYVLIKNHHFQLIEDTLKVIDYTIIDRKGKEHKVIPGEVIKVTIPTVEILYGDKK